MAVQYHQIEEMKNSLEMASTVRNYFRPFMRLGDAREVARTLRKINGLDQSLDETPEAQLLQDLVDESLDPDYWRMADKSVRRVIGKESQSQYGALQAAKELRNHDARVTGRHIISAPDARDPISVGKLIKDRELAEAHYVTRGALVERCMSYADALNGTPESKYLAALGEEHEDLTVTDVMRAPLHTPIKYLMLSMRASNGLEGHGVTLLGQLVRLPKRTFTQNKIKNVGKKTNNEIIAEIERLGLRPGMRLPWWDIEAVRPPKS